MDSKDLLSKLIIFMKYSKYLESEHRRETWEELCDRAKSFLISTYPLLKDEITYNIDNFIKTKKVLSSMRLLQFSGPAIERSPIRAFNCSYLPVDHWLAFPETMFLLLSGTGVGYSVQHGHIKHLPEIHKSNKTRRFLVADTIEGWADAVKMLMKSYFFNKPMPVFDFSDIRPKGSPLKTSGGKAPGPEVLKTCLHNIQTILDRKNIGDQLTSLEVNDIQCFIANAVLAGGVRRSSCIAFFDIDDDEMLSCKTGMWWETNPQRSMANNSAVIVRHKVTENDFKKLWGKIQASGTGEPGVYFTNDFNMLSNPCVSGDTEILTDNGYVRIDSVVDTNVNVWNGFEWSTVTPKITGHSQPMLKVEFSDGRSLNCTTYHNFHIAQGYRGTSKIVKAKDLKIGDNLIKHSFPVIEHGIEMEHAYTNGFVSAEGMELNRSLSVYKPKEMCIPRLNIKTCKWRDSNGRFNVKLKDQPCSKSLVPFEYNLKSKLEWLSGLFDGDGCELKEGGLQLVSVNHDFIYDLQKMLSTIGIQSKITLANEAGDRLMPDGRGGERLYPCQETKRILIGSIQMQELKRLGLSCERLKFNKTPQRDASRFVSVTKITKIDDADTVYCFNEPKRHTVIFNGLLTGQCVEASLRPFTLCNLTEINMGTVVDQADFEERARSAAFIGTLQAGLTNFHYLRPIWKTNTEKDALLGVSQTGTASEYINSLDLRSGALTVLDENERVAKMIGINTAARCCLAKPSGTASIVLGTSSGVHAWHSPFYIRRVRINKQEPIYKYLKSTIPELLEDEVFKPNTEAVLSVPIKAPEGAITRKDESAIDLLKRVKKYHDEWIKPSHRRGDNTHNVSCTVNIRPGEYEAVGKWMWENRNSYNGIATLPHFDPQESENWKNIYPQLPFEEIGEEEYLRLSAFIKDIDLTQVLEYGDNTDQKMEAACSGGKCELF